MKIVINGTFGGFNVDRTLAEKMYKLGCRAPELLKSLGYAKYDYWYSVPRNNKHLVAAVEALATNSNWRDNRPFYKDLTVVEVDTTRPWYLHEYDGFEEVRYFEPGRHGCELE